MQKLKQLFCVHWFDIGPDYLYEEGRGPIICTEQRIYRVTMQRRVCSKCGLTEERPVGEPVCIGWA